MADDFSGVTVTFDKPSYVQGDVMTLKVAGLVVSPTVGTVGPLVVTVVNPADGATSSVNVAPVPVTMNVATAAKMQAVVDNGTPTHTWTLAADGMTATATA